MNETQKTGIFSGVAAVVALIAAIVAWPTSSDDERGMGPEINTPLFAEFKDPLEAASLKIVTFNEEQGELKNFEVRKDAESGLWTIPSKGGYPADAVEQMRDAANALVALNILDVPTDNPEDHAGMGVVEPKLEDLNPGDEGVGRLVTFKDKSQGVLASLIIGGEVKGQEGQVYVRKPGQDPVYVVALDDTPLSTNFEEWIEEDLLQLTSIDVENVELKDYNASLGLQGVALERNYVVSLVKDGATWELDSLKEYDKTNPLAEPIAVEVDPTKQLNTQKLNDITNALDDLKFVDVKRKPDGISANLKADKDFASDQEAATQLAARGFIPIPLGPNREIEILSANGELTATTKDGVKYILRFGNISGISEGESGESDDAEGDAGGVNRYLMVSTVVDESKFPVPDLQPIPQTIEELDKLDQAAEQAAPVQEQASPAQEEAPAETAGEEQPGETMPADDAAADAEMTEAEAAADSESSETAADASPDAADKPSDDAPAEEADTASGEPSANESADEAKPAEEAEGPEGDDSGETEVSGEGEATAVGEGQDPTAEEEPADDEPAEEEPAQEEAEQEQAASDEAADSADAKPAMENAPAAEAVPADEQETEEEKQERLAAVQEKITKDNERKLEERKEKLENARVQSKVLNERFADWYYVIPEDTYSKLRVSREELFESEAAAPAFNPAAAPPGFPGMGGGLPAGLGN